MKLLITADLHFTDSPRDSYRLQLFQWLAEETRRNGVSYVIILGDLTEAKDRHCATLTNAIVDGLRLIDSVRPVIVLRGNHDGPDEKCPFFRFLNQAGIDFFIEPTVRTLGGKKCLFLPHTRTVRAYGEGFNYADFDYIFAHQTFTGSNVGHGKRLMGLPATTFSACRGRVFAGDIHIPQRLSNIDYIGSPYHIDFGDDFLPRVALVEGHDVRDINPPFPSKRKIIIDGTGRLGDLRVNAGDMLKFDVRLKRAEFDQWDECRRMVQDFAERTHTVLCGVKLVERDVSRLSQSELASKRMPPRDLFNNFCSRNTEQIGDDLREAGSECLIT